MGLFKHQPGCPCCCPDCSAPTAEETGSSAQNTAWYLTPNDSGDVTHTDAASYHVVLVTDARFINQTAILPGTAYCRLRSYFAYEDSSNCAFAEIWGVTSGSVGNYVVTYYSRVVEVTSGTESELATHTIGVVSTSFPIENGAIAVTYDETANIVRVVCMVSSDNTDYQHWRSYDCLSLTQSPAKGLRYGWGYGPISGTAPTGPTSAFDNLRHIDYCQGFPHIYVGSSTYVINSTTHNWLKSMFPETATLEVSGVTCDSGYYAYCDDCAAANDTFSMTRPEVDQVIAQVWNAENLVASDIDAGCVDSQFSWNYKIQYRLQSYGATADGGTGNVRLCAYAIPYTNLGVRFNVPVLLATSEASFTGTCKTQYDGANAIDGLVFNQWTNAGTAGAPVVITNGTPPVVILALPDFSGATATITLP